jgi:arylsulfatase A-like enzyme
MEWPAMISRNHNISWPGVSSDLLPTILDIFGVQSSHPSWVLDGVSLLPVIAVAEAGGALPRRAKGIGHATMLPGDGWDPLNGRCAAPSFDSSYIVATKGTVGQVSRRFPSKLAVYP